MSQVRAVHRLHHHRHGKSDLLSLFADVNVCWQNDFPQLKYALLGGLGLLALLQRE